MKSNTATSMDTASQSGLSAYFARIYNYMAGSLLLSAFTGFLATQQPLVGLLFKQTPTGYGLTLLGILAVIAPFILIFMIHSSFRKLNVARAQTLFWIFSACMGLSFATIFLTFTPASVFQALLVSAAAFLGLSLYGYTTKRYLMNWGSFLIVGLIGLIIAMIVNIFVGSTALGFALSVIGIFIFLGLVAYDTQRLKLLYQQAYTPEAQHVLAISGALSLYLSFINLFHFILALTGSRR